MISNLLIVNYKSPKSLKRLCCINLYFTAKIKWGKVPLDGIVFCALFFLPIWYFGRRFFFCVLKRGEVEKCCGSKKRGFRCPFIADRNCGEEKKKSIFLHSTMIMRQNILIYTAAIAYEVQLEII